MEQPTSQFNFKVLDADAMEQRIYDRIVAKIKENDLLCEHIETPSVSIPDLFYPTEAISAMELYVRETKGLSSVTLTEQLENWNKLGGDLQAGYQKRATQINQNYLCLRPPNGLKGNEIKVPTFDNAMKRVFFNKRLEFEPAEFRKSSIFPAIAKNIKVMWEKLSVRERATCVSAANDLLCLWRRAAEPSDMTRKIELSEVMNNKYLAPTSAQRMFTADFVKKYGNMTESDVNDSWKNADQKLVQYYLAYASKLNHASISLEPPSDLKEDQIPSVEDFRWRIYAKTKLSQTALNFSHFCEWLEATRKEWNQCGQELNTDCLGAATSLQNKWRAAIKQPKATSEELPTTGRRLFEKDYLASNPGAKPIWIDNAWTMLDRSRKEYCERAQQLNDDYIRLEPRRGFGEIEAPTIEALQWRIFFSKNRQHCSAMPEDGICGEITSIRCEWLMVMAESPFTHFQEAGFLLKKWIAAAHPAAAPTTAAQLFAADYRLKHPGHIRQNLDVAWLQLDPVEVSSYVRKAGLINHDHIRLTPPADLTVADAPTRRTLQWRIFLSAQPKRTFISDHEFCCWIESMAKMWSEEPSESYAQEATSLREEWLEAANKKKFSSEEIEASVGPNVVHQPSVKPLTKVVAVQREKARMSKADCREQLLNRKAMHIYSDHYRRDARKRNPYYTGSAFREQLEEAEAKWEKLTAAVKRPYIELARESMDQREKRDAYLKNTPLPL